MASAKQTAYETIKHRINTCVYLPGDVVSESDLMRDLGIGRTPIREALNKLECDQLLKIYPKRGIFISDISLQDVYDIYNMLAILEPEVAFAAAEKGDKEILRNFMETYRSYDEAQYMQEFRALDAELHSMLGAQCGNQLLCNYLSELHAKNARVRLLSKMHSDQRVHETRQEHLTILQAICDGDSQKAYNLMKEHVANGKQSALAI